MLGNGSIRTHQAVPVAKAGPAARPAARAIGPPPTTEWLKTRELAEALSVSLAAMEAEDQREAVAETAPSAEPPPEPDVSDPGVFELGDEAVADSDEGSPEAYLVVAPEAAVEEASQLSPPALRPLADGSSDQQQPKPRRRLRKRDPKAARPAEAPDEGSPKVEGAEVPALDAVAPEAKPVHTPDPKAVTTAPEPKAVPARTEPEPDVLSAQPDTQPAAASEPTPESQVPDTRPAPRRPAHAPAAAKRRTGVSGSTPSAPGARGKRPISPEQRGTPSPGKARKLPAPSGTAASTSDETGTSKSPTQADDPDAHQRQMKEELRAVSAASGNEETPPSPVGDGIAGYLALEPLPSATIGRADRGVESDAGAPPEKKRRFLKKRDGGRDKLMMPSPEQPPARATPVVESRAPGGGRQAERVDMNPYRVRAAEVGLGAGAPSGHMAENPGGKAMKCRSCGKPSQWGMCETCGEAFGELRQLSASLGIDEIA